MHPEGSMASAGVRTTNGYRPTRLPRGADKTVLAGSDGTGRGSVVDSTKVSMPKRRDEGACGLVVIDSCRWARKMIITVSGSRVFNLGDKS